MGVVGTLILSVCLLILNELIANGKAIIRHTDKLEQHSEKLQQTEKRDDNQDRQITELYKLVFEKPEEIRIK